MNARNSVNKYFVSIAKEGITDQFSEIYKMASYFFFSVQNHLLEEKLTLKSFPNFPLILSMYWSSVKDQLLLIIFYAIALEIQK